MGSSSKTTKAGIVGAGLAGIIGVLAAFGYITSTQATAIITAIGSLTTMIVAMLAKDHDVTGGVVQNPDSSKTTKGAIDVPPVAIPPVVSKEG